ncbi:tubulin folding cofactor C [Cryptococcus deuterogattii MMRL2647]|nr:tubulin folding cofactor C [Cryptococcus deuterogattii MMRL2647]
MATNEQGVVSTAQSAELHSLFHSQKQGILQSLEEQSSTSITDISKRISSLRTLVDSFGEGLPKYDRGRYASQITELESKVAILRAKEKPKSRFAFTKPKSSPSPGAGQSRPSPTIPPPTSSGATSNVSSLTASSSDDVPQAPEPTASSSSSTSASTMHTISSLTDTLVRPELAPGTGAYTLSLSHLCRCVIDLCPPHATEPERGPELGLSSVDGTARTTLTKPTLTTLHAKDLQQCIMVAPVLPGSAMLSEMVDCLVIVGAQQVYESKHTQVQDFDWVRGGQSPNWSLVSKDQASVLFTQEMASRLYNVREKDENLVMEWTKRLRSS